MTMVFIGGSRRVSHLDADVRRRLEAMIRKRLPVVVGDANGADKAVQQFFQGRDYSRVTVFCSGKECRNNLGNWPVRCVRANGNKKDFRFFAAKDRAMAAEASVGLMIWDGKSAGTLLNVFRLVRLQKKVVVYLAPSRRFVEVKTETDWEALMQVCDAGLRQRIREESSS
jgi:hypothetical protein